MTKDVYYFSHDSNARRDPKILAMRTQYGVQGYGWYWIIIEVLSEQGGYKLEHKNWAMYAIAMEMQCEVDAAASFIDALVNDYELLTSDKEWFWSESLLRRMEMKDEKKRRRTESAKKAANARWGNADDSKGFQKEASHSNANALRNVSERNADYAKGKERKGKETKVKEIKTAAASNDVPKPLESDNPDNAIANWQKLWLFPNQFQLEDINHLIDEYSDDLVSAAIKIAGSKDVTKGSSINFIEAVLKEWRDNNVTTIDQAREYQRSRSTKFKANNNYGKSTKVEKLPDWANEPQPTEEKEIDEEIQQEFLDRLQRFREGNPS